VTCPFCQASFGPQYKGLFRIQKAIVGGLRERGDDPLTRQLDEAKYRIGELSMEIEILRRERQARRPLGVRRSSR
jgi:hypothetical protein